MHSLNSIVSEDGKKRKDYADAFLRLKAEVEGLEVTVEQSGLQDSDNETLSVSSGESQEG
jgi:hypothetical protein